MQHIYLSRSNLHTLVSKLNRAAAGETSACAIIKYRNKCDEPFAQTINEVTVHAVEDNAYYANRPAGEMLPVDTLAGATLTHPHLDGQDN